MAIAFSSISGDAEIACPCSCCNTGPTVPSRPSFIRRALRKQQQLRRQSGSPWHDLCPGPRADVKGMVSPLQPG